MEHRIILCTSPKTVTGVGFILKLPEATQCLFLIKIAVLETTCICCGKI
jgi:hypothetical protein